MKTLNQQQTLLQKFKEQQSRASNSAEIFASFTMSKIDPKVRSSLSEEQQKAIWEALIASEKSNKHSIDVRGSFSLYLAHYYFVFFAGRDRRKSTHLVELVRNSKGNKQASFLFTGIGIIFIGLIVLIVGFMTAYYLKSEMGIDIFPGKHLGDFVKEFFEL